jgi:hypothetical protein
MESGMQSRLALQSRPTTQPAWYRQRWPWLLMLGPILVIIAGSYTCWLAFTRPDALVVDDYYMQGKAINQDLRRDQAAAALGMSATLRYDPAAAGVTANVRSFGRPWVSGAWLHLVHSTRPEKDILVHLESDGAGGLHAALPMLEQARWRVLIEDSQRQWRLAGPWSWPAQTSVKLQANAAPQTQPDRQQPAAGSGSTH